VESGENLTPADLEFVDFSQVNEFCIFLCVQWHFHMQF